MDQLTADEIRASLRSYFADKPALKEVRAHRDTTDPDAPRLDVGTWRRLASELGLAGIAAPEAWGGLGLDMSYAVAAVEECGAALYPGPVHAAVLVAASMGALDPDTVVPQFRSLLHELLAGELIVGSSTHVDDAAGPELVVDADGRHGRVTGRVDAVTHGGLAGLIVTVARTEHGPAAVLVAAGDDAQRNATPSVDIARPLAAVVVGDAPALLLTALGDSAALQDFRTREALLLAAEQVGGSQGCLDQMVAYATVREQFGALIGTYQAIQHRCSATAVAVAAARSLVAAAADALDSEQSDVAAQLTLLARADAADAYLAASDSLIQVSGGIGFTWEHDAHLYFRRARALSGIGGTPAQLRGRAVESGCLDLLLAGRERIS